MVQLTCERHLPLMVSALFTMLVMIRMGQILCLVAQTSWRVILIPVQQPMTAHVWNWTNVECAVAKVLLPVIAIAMEIQPMHLAFAEELACPIPMKMVSVTIQRFWAARMKHLAITIRQLLKMTARVLNLTFVEFAVETVLLRAIAIAMAMNWTPWVFVEALVLMTTTKTAFAMTLK